MFQKQSLVLKIVPYFDADVSDTCSISSDESPKYTLNDAQFLGLGKEVLPFRDF